MNGKHASYSVHHGVTVVVTDTLGVVPADMQHQAGIIIVDGVIVKSRYSAVPIGSA